MNKPAYSSKYKILSLSSNKKIFFRALTKIVQYKTFYISLKFTIQYQAQKFLTNKLKWKKTLATSTPYAK